MVPFGKTYRLYARGGAGICCDIDGVSLGPIKLVERSDEVAGKRYRICEAKVLAEALTTAYGPLLDEIMIYLARGIFRVTQSLEDGNLPLAMIKAVHLKFPEIQSDNMSKLDIVVMEKYNQNHDERGRFSSGPGAEAIPHGGDGAPPERFKRDGSGNLVYSDEVYGGPFSDNDAALRVSDPYGAPRDAGKTLHAGIDLTTGGRSGIDTRSLTEGEVVQVGARGFGPHSVTIKTPKGTYFTYGHLKSNSVKVGDHVKAGQPLGEIGNLGASTGIHVHIQASTGAAFGAKSKMLGIRFLSEGR